MWVLVASAIFGLYDNPPRKTQAEINKAPVPQVVDKPVVATVQTQPKVEEKAPTPVAPPTPQPAPQPKVEAVKVRGVTNCGDNPYKQYIYQKESGCRTDAMNSIGCRGIGQACPGSKLPCSNSDFACQDAWFSNYAIQRYGSWERAYNFWINNHWW